MYCKTVDILKYQSDVLQKHFDVLQNLFDLLQEHLMYCKFVLFPAITV